MTPKRIQRSRAKGWKMQPMSIYVGRPTIWGNPFIHETDVQQAVDAYRSLINGGTISFEMGPNKLQFAHNANRNTLHWAYADYVRDHVHTLRGFNLCCWCGPSSPCHADVLLELANAAPAKWMLPKAETVSKPTAEPKAPASLPLFGDDTCK